jgi:hypothetical protein
MSDDEKPPIAEVIDLASRRHERATLAGRTETILINPNSLKIKFGDDGGFTIQAEGVRRRAKGFEKVEWEVKAIGTVLWRRLVFHWNEPIVFN